MCKYCELKPDNSHPDYIFTQSSIVSEFCGNWCRIAYHKPSQKYVIKLKSLNYNDSEPISFCPFCGRKLKD